jgi:hypothetical protein
MKGGAAISLLGRKVNLVSCSGVSHGIQLTNTYSRDLALGFLAGTLEVLDKSVLRSDQGLNSLPRKYVTSLISLQCSALLASSAPCSRTITKPASQRPPRP